MTDNTAAADRGPIMPRPVDVRPDMDYRRLHNCLCHRPLTEAEAARPLPVEVIDSHVHLDWNRSDCDPLEYLAIAEEEGLGLLLASALHGHRDQPLGNNETIAYCRQYPDLIRGLAWANPTKDGCVENLREVLAEPEMCGIKIHPFGDEYEPTLELLAGVFEVASEFNVPICTHTDAGGNCNPAQFVALLETFNQVKFVLYHARPSNTVLWVAGKYPNVYVETSWVVFPIIRMYYDFFGPDRILFGTDAYAGFIGPLKGDGNIHRRYRSLPADLVALDIPANDAAKIMAGNTRCLFGL